MNEGGRPHRVFDLSGRCPVGVLVICDRSFLDHLEYSIPDSISYHRLGGDRSMAESGVSRNGRGAVADSDHRLALALGYLLLSLHSFTID